MNDKIENKKLKKLRRSRSSNFYLVIFSLILIIFGFFIFRYISYLKAKITKESDFLQVCIVKEEIPSHTVISEEMIMLIEIPRRYLLNNAVLDKNLVLGSITKYPLYKGEQILSSKISKNTDDLMSLPENIPVDKRVITLPLDNQSMIPPSIKTGDKVDVIANFHTDINTNENTLSNTRLIAPARTVLSVKSGFLMDNKLREKKDEKEGSLGLDFLDVNISNSEKWITILVQSEEVIEIARAMANGRLFFSLCPSDSYESKFYGN